MKVVIVGAGFAGLRLARKLNNKNGFEVLLIDKFNYHQFQPLFYQVATAALDASNISFPLRKAFHKSRNVRIRVEELKEVRTGEKVIITESETIPYDVLVLALGADTNFFNNQNLITYAFPMKSTVESIQLRHRFIQNFEDAVRTQDPAHRERLLNIVVAGGGPTGVELAGALAEMRRYVLPSDYPEIDFRKMNIYLLEGGERVLAAMDPRSSDTAIGYLKKLGVEVRLRTILKDYDGKNALLGDGSSIPTEMVIWAAGIRGNVPAGIDPSLVVRGNRVKVDEFNRVDGLEHVYVLGDLAAMVSERYPLGHPQVAPAAIQQAEQLYENLKRQVRNQPMKPFEYKDKGSMATVGRNLAVVDVPKPKLHFRGLFAWLIWMGLHLLLILGVKNRLFVFLNWVYSYITYDQSLRLIFKEFYRPKQPVDATKQAQVAGSARPES